MMFLAEFAFDALWQGIARSAHDSMAIIMPVAVVSVLVLFWAAFLRRRPRHHFHRFGRHGHAPHAAGPASPASQPPAPVHHHSPHRRRHRHHDHRPRNPTLAETGGLPPLRPDPPPEPFP